MYLALQLEKGLADESSLLMIPTMVDILPQGYDAQEIMMQIV